MKKLTKSIITFTLVITMLVCFCGTAFAARWQWVSFPEQSTSGYSNYTYGIQSMMRCFSEGTFKAVGSLDGIFGANTESAVEIYQNTRGLSPDGIVGPNTWGRLWDELSYTGTTVGTYLNYNIAHGYITDTAISKSTTTVQGAVVTHWYAYYLKSRIQFGAS